MTRQSNGGEDRLDRAERLLEQLIERQIHSDNRLDRLENAIESIDALILRNAQQIERNEQQIERNAQLIERNAQQIERNSELSERNEQKIAVFVREMGFLRAAVQGHISQSSPPAHPD